MDYAELLRSFYEELVARDPQIASNLDELREMRGDTELQTSLESLSDLEGIDSPGDVAIETIVSRFGRPVLEVFGNEYSLEGPETTIWQDRLGGAKVRERIGKIIPAVGRIEVQNFRMDWLGTGWLADEDIVITNRHVAEIFAAAKGGKFDFRMGVNGKKMTSRIDFHEEVRSKEPAEFSVLDVLHIEGSGGPDIAFLKVKRTGPSGNLPKPIVIAKKAPASQDYVATVGYPAEDSRIPDQELVIRLFGNVYNVKRMAPGQVKNSGTDLVTHDCSTLGGNSGSPLFRLDNGEVVGLHFSGLFLQENRCVPAAEIARLLARMKRGPVPPRPLGQEVSHPGSPGGGSGSATWNIPLQVTVNFGTPQLVDCGNSGGNDPDVNAPNVGDPVLNPSDPPTDGPLSGAVEAARGKVGNSPDVLAVREGYRFRNGWITKKKAVVVLVKGSQALAGVEAKVPREIGGHPVQVRVAGPWDYLETQQALETLEGVPETAYKKPKDFELEEVTTDMRVICHVSPDAGWATLRKFLGETRKRLTIGMYDFTAPHIIEAIEDAVDDKGRKLLLVLQRNESLGKTGVKANDIPEKETKKRYEKALKDRFEFEWASVGKGRQFASAYHIKVAVQDEKAFWLSSGNWQTSNQPRTVDRDTWDALLTHNREWHVVVDCPALAEQYEKYIRYDFKNARKDADTESMLPELEFFVAPVLEARRVRPTGTPRYFEATTFEKELKVMPLLTPDNYEQEVLKLIKSAKKAVLFQNQSLSLLADDKNDERFSALADALLDRQEKGCDVRIIMRGEFDVSRPLEQLQERGFDMERVRLQDHCHTKGIIVDGKRVCIGSHNWTNQGTLVNRDASLIFHDQEIAEYFREIFEFDWKNLTRQSVDEAREVVIADAAREAPSDMTRVSWEEILLD